MVMGYRDNQAEKYNRLSQRDKAVIDSKLLIGYQRAMEVTSSNSRGGKQFKNQIDHSQITPARFAEIEVVLQMKEEDKDSIIEEAKNILLKGLDSKIKHLPKLLTHLPQLTAAEKEQARDAVERVLARDN